MKRLLLTALLMTATLAGNAIASPGKSFGQTYFTNDYLRPSP